MNSILDLWREALVTTVLVCLPLVVGALTVGVVTSLLQAATQMNDAAFSFVPKLLVIGLVLAVGGHALLDRLGRFTLAAIEAAGEVGLRDRQ